MKVFLIVGIINGLLAVSLGAFGAHGLEGKVSEKSLAIWDKAVTYQMFHTIAILMTGLLITKIQQPSISLAGWLFLAGIVLFSGSLYAYAITGTKYLAMITPFGGLMFLAAWVILGYGVVKFL